MYKFLTVGLAVLTCGLGVAESVHADAPQKDNYSIQFTGEQGSRVRGSIVWTDARNPNKPNYMETANGISIATITLNLPAGSIVSATGSSDVFKPVTIKIIRNSIECDDQPIEDKRLSSTKSCTP